MDGSLLIADHDVCRGREFEGFFSNIGLSVAMVANGLDCIAELARLQPDTLIIDMHLPWGGGDGVVAWLTEEVSVQHQPLILLIGDAPVAKLSALSGVPSCNCFASPVSKEDLLVRIGAQYSSTLCHRARAGWK